MLTYIIIQRGFWLISQQILEARSDILEKTQSKKLTITVPREPDA